MADVISLLDSDDDVPVVQRGPSIPATTARAQPAASATALGTYSRFGLPDLSSDDDDAFPTSLLPPRAPSAGAASSRFRSRCLTAPAQASAPQSIVIDVDDDIIEYQPPSEAGSQGPSAARTSKTRPSEVLYVDDDVEVVAVVEAPPRKSSATSAQLRASAYTAPSFPFDLSRPFSTQAGPSQNLSRSFGSQRYSSPVRRSLSPPSAAAALAGSSHRVGAAPEPLFDFPPSVSPDASFARADSGVAFSRVRSPSPDTLTNAVASSSRAPLAADDNARTEKRKKYSLDSSSADEDDAAYLRRVAQEAKAAGKAPKRVKGARKGKERATNSPHPEEGGTAVTGVSEPPKRKRKTAEEIAFDAAEKAREKADKAEEAARRKAEKELFKEANKLRSRTTAMQELFLDLPRQSATSKSIIARIKPELLDRLEETGVRLNEHDPPGEIDNIIRFKREVKAEYDDLKRVFVSVDPRVQLESTAILLLSADDAAAHVRARTWLALPGRVRAQAGLTAKGQVVLIVIGLGKYYKAERSAAAREYDALVRGGGGGGASAAAAARRAAVLGSIGAAQVGRDELEKAFVQLQVVDRSFLTRVETDKEVVDFVMSFAGDVAHRPYKLIEYSHLPFCPDTSIPKGASPSDTFCKMLSTVKGVTPAMTHAVLRAYPTLRCLMEAYDRVEQGRGGEKEADLLLQDLVAEHRVDGAPNARIINKAKSAQIRRMLRGEDPRALWG